MEGLKNMHTGYQMANAERKKKGLKMILPHWYQKREPAILQADITKTSTAEILAAGGLQVGEASLLEGGFPCQGFSTAGARIINDPRNKLYKECVRVIREALPRIFFLENVPGLVSMAKGRIIRQIVKDLAGCGYNISWDILDACDYGVPQHRKRVFINGLRKDVAIFRKNGRMELHMGACPGTEHHPDWFLKKYPA
jgi:DNA-cytosine methyltransferase